jgi:DNA-binding NtrC family response regulator
VERVVEAEERAGEGAGVVAEVGDRRAARVEGAEVERLLIQETLRATGGNKQRAADLLGIAARTIYRKI